MSGLYKGYVACNGKQAIMPFKNKTTSELLTLGQASVLQSYGGVLAETTILIDIDDYAQSEILFNIVLSKKLKCKVLRTSRGKHFLFKIDKPLPNRTHIQLAIGLTADIKGCGSSSYQVLKLDGLEREVLYDTGDYEIVPKYLLPVKSNINLLGMNDGEGRNNALFGYILPLQQNDYTKEECREVIGIINDYVLKEPLPQSELSTVLRDGAFEKPTFFNSKGAFLFDKFASYLVRVEHIIKLNGKLYIYRNGIYECGDDYIERAMIEHIPNLSQSRRREVLAYLNLLVKSESAVADAELIAFNNGVLDIISDTFMDFDPSFIITNKVPHNYNPNAKSELLERTMRKLACDDESVLKLLYQAVGYSSFRKNELRKSFFLLGPKRNGKSTFLDMVSTLLGEENISNLDLSEIGHQFRTAELTGRLANIGDDIGDEWVANAAVFKKVVSGDVITVEKKGKDPYKLRSFAKFFFSANSLPRIGRGRDSAAVLDRLVIIPFDATFSKADADYDPFIKYKLRSEEVMEALIAKAIPALKEVLADQEFAQCDKVLESLKEFEKSNNPILEFYDELDDVDYINEPVKSVYQRYNTFTMMNNLQPISALEFQKQMKAQFNVVVKTITNKENKRVRVYAREE